MYECSKKKIRRVYHLTQSGLVTFSELVIGFMLLYTKL